MVTKANNGEVVAPKRTSAATNLVAGGGAGMMEALICHPLDTIKVRMQLSRRAQRPGTTKRGFLATGLQIINRETPLALYKGIGAVTVGIIPKMAIRFTSYEYYKSLLTSPDGSIQSRGTFMAGLAAGVTEAVAVVTPMEVVKIRLQAQYHSMSDPLDVPKYRNAAHACYTVVREEGVAALYRGVTLTALRQGSNQAVNFTVYNALKSRLQDLQSPTLASSPTTAGSNLPGYQTALIGLISGACGPLSNAPIDTIKTRLQRQPAAPGQSALSRIREIVQGMIKQEGVRALYKGITPRIMRVAPGQAVTFAVYEQLKTWIERTKEDGVGGYELR